MGWLRQLVVNIFIARMSLRIDAQVAQSIVDKYEYFLFDCDGVIWLGDHLLPSVVETLELLKSKNKTVLFVTNNSTKARDDYQSKFAKLGIHGITKQEVFGSSYASAVYIDKILQLPKDKKIWVLGEKGIEKELNELGYSTIGGLDPLLNVDFDPEHPQLNHIDEQVGAVVTGLTTNVNYLKMSITMQYLLDKSLPFIATNIDSTYPSKGKLLVGAGSIIESVAFASGRQPDAICGKPNQSMMNSIKADHPGLAANPAKGLMVGDRLNTDMKFGRDGGLDTLLVLTGIETEADVQHAAAAGEAPTYYTSKLGDLFELTQS